VKYAPVKYATLVFFEKFNPDGIKGKITFHPSTICRSYGAGPSTIYRTYGVKVAPRVGTLQRLVNLRFASTGGVNPPDTRREIPPDRQRASNKEIPLLSKKFFFAWLKPLHDLDLLCLPDLINPWSLHFFAVII